jgi:hypothetical protein
MSNNPNLQAKLRLLDDELHDGEITQKGLGDPIMSRMRADKWTATKSGVQ